MDKNELYLKIKNIILNISVLMIFFAGLLNIGLLLPYRYKFVRSVELYYYHIAPEALVIHRAMATAVGLIMLFISHRLFKRMKIAWFITELVLQISIVLYILKFHSFLHVFPVTEFFIFIILIIWRKDFTKETNRINLKWGVIVALVSVFLILLDTALGLFFLGNHYNNVHNFKDALMRSLELLFYMDVSAIEPRTRVAVAFAESAVILNWASIITAVFLVLKPLIYQPIRDRYDTEKVRNYLNLYGFNPISYVAVEKDKKYFFSSIADGVIAYVIAGGVAVCAGDPICSDENVPILVGQFMTHCRENDLDICFLQTTDKLLPFFKSMGFGITKYGEEAMFDLKTYNISGGKAAKVRQAVNNANRHEINVIEYKPQHNRDRKLESEIMDVSKEWLAIKKNSELSFMLGSVGLDNPMDRRYFTAIDKNGKVQGFVVFIPFKGKDGYYADVTRRRDDAPIGVMEKIITSAFDTMKSEGISWGSLGLAPLANLKEKGNKKTIADAALDFVYEHMNSFYGFKTLHQYKKKYNPTYWEPRYMVYYPKMFTPKIAYSIIKAQNPKGVTDFLFTQMKQIFSGKDPDKEKSKAK